MRWRGPVVVLVLLAVGIVGGYAVAAATDGSAHSSGAAEPAEARNPSLPADPRGTLRPAPDYPALEPGVALVDATIGANGFETTFSVPRGWNEIAVASNESKWKRSGAPNNTYILRVEQIFGQRETLEQAAAAWAARLIETQDHPVIVEQRPGYLEYTAVSDERTARRGFVRWLDLTGSGFAELEVAATGRERDAAGTRDLVDRVAESARPGP